MYCVVLITAKDTEEAKKIASKLVEEKLIACANILSGVNSIFWWEEKVCEEQEVLMVIKTRKNLFKRIVSVVRSLHSYSVPEIIALPIVDGHKEYLNWLKSSTQVKRNKGKTK